MDKTIKLKLDTKEIDRVSIGGMLYDALDYGNMNNIYGTKEDKSNGIKIATISKDDIWNLIKLVNRDSMFRDFNWVEVVD